MSATHLGRGTGGEELSQSELAAALRAQHRKELDSAGEGSILDDVAAAEAAYDEPDELITEDGIPIEPFNLRREREEGYFDADGTSFPLVPLYAGWRQAFLNHAHYLAHTMCAVC